MVRIGMVNYINTAPLYEIWKKRVKRPDWEIVEAPPARLNRLLAAGELDMGCVSSYEYAARPQRYRILSGLSISADGPVGSVYLFSRIAVEELSGRLILLSGQSETSVCLVRILLEDYYRQRPEYIRGEVFADRDREREIVAVLAIGDDALRLRAEGRYPLQFDLGEMWHQHTGLPFVFAVYAVREELIARNPDTVREIHRTLQQCLADGLADLERIAAAVAPRIPMTQQACLAYLQAMEYDLNAAKQEALKRFFTLLIHRGEAREAALPLKLFS